MSKDAIKEWARLRKSGNHKKPLHPDTARNTQPIFADTPDDGSSSTSTSLGKRALLLIMLVLNLIIWGVFFLITQCDKDPSVMLDDLRSNLEVVAAPTWEEEQSIAIEKIRAWERAAQYAIDKWYATPMEERGMLCIRVEGKLDCSHSTTIDSSLH
jgi:hypothetical protein